MKNFLSQGWVTSVLVIVAIVLVAAALYPKKASEPSDEAK